MSLKPPSGHGIGAVPDGNDMLGIEIAAEMASSLGRAGGEADRALRALEATGREDPARPQALKDAAGAVYAYFIQRELCGLRRHHDAISHYRIPREVLARLGAS